MTGITHQEEREAAGIASVSHIGVFNRGGNWFKGTVMLGAFHTSLVGIQPERVMGATTAEHSPKGY